MASTGSPNPFRAMLADRPFLVAAGILLLAAASWGLVIDALGLVFAKYPLPWPKPTIIGEDFRLKSFPSEFGTYRLTPEGDKEHEEENLESLRIGGTLDDLRYEARTSNWYSFRVYEDARETLRATPYVQWALGQYFYNGGVDLVAHVGERCLAAGGITDMTSESILLDMGEIRDEKGTVIEAWSGEIPVRRIHYTQVNAHTGGLEPGVEYYTFALNGRPEEDWREVRLKTTSFFLKYCYFAKLQFHPGGLVPEEDLGESDRRAAEFLRAALPHILKNLPTAQDVEQLEKAS